MSAIVTNVSSVSSFVKDTVSQYNQIISLANVALSRINEMTVFVEGEKEKLEKQIKNEKQPKKKFELVQKLNALKQSLCK